MCMYAHACMFLHSKRITKVRIFPYVSPMKGVQTDASDARLEFETGHCYSRPRLYDICTSWRPESTLPRMCRSGQWSFVGVVTGWGMSYRLCRVALAKTDQSCFMSTAGHDHVIVYRFIGSNFSWRAPGIWTTPTSSASRWLKLHPHHILIGRTFWPF